MLVIARHDREVMAACCGGDIAVFDRHWASSLCQQKRLIGPDVGGCHVEAEDSPLQRINAPPQPFLQSNSGAPFLGSHPIGNLRDDNRARIASALFPIEPFDYGSISVRPHRLAEHIGIQQPRHGIGFFGICRLREGRSSMGTGHCFQTSSQFDFRLIRRKITTSSSGSKLASNWSPGAVGASAAGMLTRRFASTVTIMVGCSNRRPGMSICYRQTSFHRLFHSGQGMNFHDLNGSLRNL